MTDGVNDQPGGLDALRWVAWAQQRAGEDWVRARDLTQPQGFVLGFLEQNQGAVQRDIAEASGTSAANMSGVLQVLERRGLIERCAEPGDARIKRVRITDAGRALIAGFRAALQAVDESILAPLTPEERGAFQTLLLKLTEQLPRPTRDPRDRPGRDQPR